MVEEELHNYWLALNVFSGELKLIIMIKANQSGVGSIPSIAELFFINPIKTIVIK